MDEPVGLKWQKFGKLTEARSRFAKTACVYVQTDAQGCPIRVGKASEGLEAPYRGGTGYPIDAAMHGSGNFVFVAAVDKDLCEPIEGELIWEGRRCLTYNNHGKIRPRVLPMYPVCTVTQPPLRLLHSDAILSRIKLDQFRRLSTAELVESLALGRSGALKARPDGTVRDGHHRIVVLRERGVNVDTLPRDVVPHEVGE